MDATLTPKQARFVDEYLVDGNGARAAIAAGYGLAGARVRAHRLTKDNVAVRAEIRARQGAETQRLQIQRRDVLAGLLEAFAMARERREPATMVSSAREVGRMLGFYEPERHQVEVSAGADLEMGRLARLSDDELLRLMASGAGATT